VIEQQAGGQEDKAVQPIRWVADVKPQNFSDNGTIFDISMPSIKFCKAFWRDDVVDDTAGHASILKLKIQAVVLV